MKIQILGTGCPKCSQLYQNVTEAVASLGIEADIEKVTDLNTIMAFGVMVTPALAIDGQVKTSGKVPSAEDIKQILQ
ncbi:MAG: TM0996/MTH895 family glutaredoxin-like protein [Phycisphaerae bacterium]|nr:TM0996/MTH895 family glutaredoxin-like protein [Phycisphaerae bacterium]